VKAATYCRVSTDDQADTGTSLETQRERTRAHIDAQGWEFVSEFVDEGVSGAKDSRPMLDALKSACERGEVNVVVVTKHDRLSRSLLGALTLMSEFDRKGVRVEFTDEPNEKGLIRNLRFAIAEDERERIRERTTSGRRATAAKGVWVGGKPPFGFAIEDRHLVVNEEEAEVLRRACTLVLATKTLHEACEMLNAEGRLPRQVNPRRMKAGPVLWNAFKLRYALTRETLIGKHVYGKTSDVQIEVACPRIITDSEWDRVQAILNATRKQVYNRPKVFPLSSRLVSPCGLTYSGTYDATMDRRFYRCKGREHAPYCSCRRIDAQTVEDRVFEEVLAFLDDPKRLLEVAGLDKDETDESRREQIRTLDARIARLSEAITDKAADALEAGLSPTLIASAVAKLERDRDDLIERRERVVEREASRREREGRRKRISLLARASWSLVNSTDEQRKTIFALLDMRATITDQGLEIAGILREDLPAFLDVEPATTS
jgi:site-specific DNA recombinase